MNVEACLWIPEVSFWVDELKRALVFILCPPIVMTSHTHTYIHTCTHEREENRDGHEQTFASLTKKGTAMDMDTTWQCLAEDHQLYL